MQPSSGSSTSTRRGRPRSFDASLIVDRALDAFWANGFEATSLDELCAATGLSVSSVYAAFGSKRGLFDATVERYRDYMAIGLDPLVEGHRGIDDLVRFIEWIRRELLTAKHPRGCLMVNTMVELAPRDAALADATARHRRRIREALETALRRAARLGEIPVRSAAARASLIQAALFGALVTVRAGGVDEADQMLRGLVAEVRRWRR